MNTTTTRPEPADRSVLMDLLSATPAVSFGRELFALVVNVAFAVVLAVVLQPSTRVVIVLILAVAVIMTLRMIWGLTTRGWFQRTTGGR